MSKLSTIVKKNREKETLKAETNFMGGTSYALNPLDTLKIVSASSIFGEPQYYRQGIEAKDGGYFVNKLVTESILDVDKFKGKNTSKIMEQLIDEALDYDYFGVLSWAKELRRDFFMRLNPQVIMVRAAMSPARTKKENTSVNPSALSDTNMEVMQRADDVINQFTYYLYAYGNKKGIPSVLKRSWAKKIEKLSKYEVFKYHNKGLGLIDVVRICHAHGPLIDELMKTGGISVTDEQATWETLRAKQMPWTEILDTIKTPHMALLRNLRGIFTEVTEYDRQRDVLDNLKAGVVHGKQFPYRYLSAQNAIKGSKIKDKTMVIDALNDCLDISCANLPHLKGTNAFLSDNSGSAWGAIPSEYGSVKIAEIDNLSAVIGAVNSDKGIVFPFGDNLMRFEISKREGVLNQAEKISEKARDKVGQSTENGIWLFFKEAINNNIHYDNIFIYSDQQAGHGGLYGLPNEQENGYGPLGCAHGTYIDVFKLIKIYRSKVNPKVNVFSIQTAGYTNMVIPENAYRTSILYGWTGKELLYADKINKFWDEKDAEKQTTKNQ